MIMWFLIAFAIHHVYSAFLVDVEESSYSSGEEHES
jgi:Ni,Fe-hydrogenase I cytochrome b subunit